MLRQAIVQLLQSIVDQHPLHGCCPELELMGNIVGFLLLWPFGRVDINRRASRGWGEGGVHSLSWVIHKKFLNSRLSVSVTGLQYMYRYLCPTDIMRGGRLVLANSGNPPHHACRTHGKLRRGCCTVGQRLTSLTSCEKNLSVHGIVVTGVCQVTQCIAINVVKQDNIHYILLSV